MKNQESHARMLQILERNSKAPSDPWRMAQIEKIREAMTPELRAIADQLRIDFGAKLTWLDTPELSMGAEPQGEPIGEARKGFKS